MKNILLLIPNLGFGGAQRVFHDHSVELGKKYKVYECVFNKEEGVAFPTSNELIDLKVPAGKNFILKIYYFLLRCLRLRRIKKQYKIDVCISHLEGADYVNILSKGKERVILCIHGSKLHDLNITGFIGWIRKRMLMPFLYNIPDKVVTVSRDINAELIDGFGVRPDKVKTINNFFDYKKITAKANEPLVHYQELFRENKIIITSGRLALQKNQAPLLLIFSKVVINVSSKLVLLGDGELRKDLVTYSKDLGLRTYTVWDNPELIDNGYNYDVFFLGYQGNPFHYIQNSTVFAFPSSWEGFPMALCEAMICGIPVITTDCPTGPREILAPDTAKNQNLRSSEESNYGILMPLLNDFKDENALLVWQNSLEYLLKDTILQKQYIVNGRKRMLDFTPEFIMQQWEEVI